MDIKEKELGEKLVEVLSNDEIDYLETVLEKSFIIKLFRDCKQSSQDLIREEINDLYLESLEEEECDDDDFENDYYDDEEDDEEE